MQSNETLHVQQDVLLPEVWGGVHIRCTDFPGWNMGTLYWPNAEVLRRRNIWRCGRHEGHKEYAAQHSDSADLIARCLIGTEKMLGAWPGSTLKQVSQL